MSLLFFTYSHSQLRRRRRREQMPIALLGVGSDGSLWITSGDTVSWRSSFARVAFSPGINGFTAVGCGNVGLQAVQIVGTDTSGLLWHTLLDSTGVWQSGFRNV